MNRTTIGWTDYTANPVKFRDRGGRIVWACVKVSPGCAHCYAESLGLRFRKGGVFSPATMKTLTPFVDMGEMAKIRTSKVIAGKRVFIEDMSDLFGEWVTDDMLDQVFATMALRPDVTFQVLTKRAERMRDYFAGFRRSAIAPSLNVYFRDMPNSSVLVWPLPNVHIGVSVENQAAADERIPLLLKTPAAVRWVSAEPLLGPVNMEPFLQYAPMHENYKMTFSVKEWRGVDWIVVGGESGKGRRDCDVEWIKSVVLQGMDAGVPVYVKQDSGPRPGMQGRIPLEVWDTKQPAGCGMRDQIEKRPDEYGGRTT